MCHPISAPAAPAAHRHDTQGDQAHERAPPIGPSRSSVALASISSAYVTVGSAWGTCTKSTEKRRLAERHIAIKVSS
ncbi:hypothetical protein AAW51_4079 [Caldimonas brevitalea]|uniref:Uncharacterized protein n=1 Tax=Caldimonas brevitalea TaxID=413882 RepID=A0A0G3BW95_9BURK|nr:hypothetical protein AAW51_4079 [Caldimonas brevitalea]